MDAVNHQFRLAARPQGMVKREDFDYVEEPVSELADGQVLVRIAYISLDPAMRGWMAEGRSYVPPVQIGEVMRAGTVGEVVESRSRKLAVGDRVSGWLGVQQYAVCNENEVFKVDTDAAPLPTYLGALGMPGVTAYFGLLDIGAPKEGETVVVSGAAGAVGSVVGQIAKLKGCRVVGIAGGPEKCKWIVDELGFDAAIDYKSEDVNAALREHCPEGVDVYFDNVGGEILDAVLARLALKARVAICGAISQYNNLDAVKGPSNYMSLLVNRARMEGFVVIDYMGRAPEAVAEMASWIAEGKLVAREEVVEGFENFPDALQRLFRGENVGKLVLKVGS
ncbi:MAG TPA: NADP-dependent oxidoreductase [Solirubrobacteraceae bacterium]|jgi:NADPH-dependent curcumin reductase CurA|nr:NADP-dependent oxidoreductase [Solirubrobacteraceae bacterium]